MPILNVFRRDGKTIRHFWGCDWSMCCPSPARSTATTTCSIRCGTCSTSCPRAAAISTQAQLRVDRAADSRRRSLPPESCDGGSQRCVQRTPQSATTNCTRVQDRTTTMPLLLAPHPPLRYPPPGQGGHREVVTMTPLRVFALSLRRSLSLALLARLAPRRRAALAAASPDLRPGQPAQRPPRSPKSSTPMWAASTGSRSAPTSRAGAISRGFPRTARPARSASSTASTRSTTRRLPEERREGQRARAARCRARSRSVRLCRRGGKLEPLLQEADDYYSQEDYKDDRMAKGRALHPRLIAAWDAFANADKALRTGVETINDRRALERLAAIEAAEGRKARYHVEALMIQAKRVVRASNAAKPDVAAITAALADYEGSLKALEQASGRGEHRLVLHLQRQGVPRLVEAADAPNPRQGALQQGRSDDDQRRRRRDDRGHAAAPDARLQFADRSVQSRHQELAARSDRAAPGPLG